MTESEKQTLKVKALEAALRVQPHGSTGYSPFGNGITVTELIKNAGLIYKFLAGDAL